MSARSAMVHIRIDAETKTRASAALEAMGLSVSDAVRLFLHRVAADREFPLELKAPNAATRAAMSEADEIGKSRSARFASGEDLIEALEKPGS